MVKEGNIVVDVGNSFVKMGKFSTSLDERKVFDSLDELKEYFPDPTRYDWIFSSVSKKYDQVLDHFGYLNPILLTVNTKLPIKLNYNTPETLGVDRLASAVAANEKFPNSNCLIIDTGSCITYDVVDQTNCFQGGVISPGLEMRMNSMHAFTERLPDISKEWKDIPENLVGKSTKECMLNGSLSGMIHEIQGFIVKFSKEYPQLNVLLTGGDAVYFESRLKPHIFADSNLVLTGLNRILNYNK